MGEIIFDDEIPFGDEIRLDGGWVDLISSASADFIRASLGFHRALRDFIEKLKNSWYNYLLTFTLILLRLVTLWQKKKTAQAYIISRQRYIIEKCVNL